MWEQFKNDDTQYDLSDRSNDSDSDIDENYDSVYFSEADSEGLSAKASVHSKRLITRKKKLIAKWAEDKDSINTLLLHQQKTMNPDVIFGRFTVDTVNLAEVFGKSCSHVDARGSSANWKNENWTPIPSEKPKRRIVEGQQTGENLDRKFVLSQTCGALEEVLPTEEEDFDASVDDSYDFLRLHLPPSLQE